MERLNRKQTIWLARGAALGFVVQWLLCALRACFGQLRDLASTRRGLPKRP